MFHDETFRKVGTFDGVCYRGIERQPCFAQEEHPSMKRFRDQDVDQDRPSSRGLRRC